MNRKDVRAWQWVARSGGLGWEGEKLHLRMVDSAEVGVKEGARDAVGEEGEPAENVGVDT